MDERCRALNRFGLGARPGERSRIGDARRWLLAQLDAGAPTTAAPGGASPTEIAAALAALRTAARGDQGQRRDARQRLVRIAGAEMLSAIHQRVTSERPFVERLVAFWSNHLCVSAAAKLPVAVLAGGYEREVIRPHVLGRFEDMVLASAKHPAMLIYLDNAQSIGPASAGARFARRRARNGAQPGLNENYARELMELHTLGVNGGYTQQDVIELARLLTGWTVTRAGSREPGGGRVVSREPGAGRVVSREPGAGSNGAAPIEFAFRAQLHEPGTRTILGARYLDGGVEEGERAIRALCRHPSTANFVAAKLVRHFVADEPPASAVEEIAGVFRESGGDLRAVSQALVQLPDAWREENRKFRTPQDWLVAVLRAFNRPDAGSAPVQLLRQLRHPLWGPAAPKGFGDTMAEWADPDSLMNRAELARSVARRAGRDRAGVDARVLLDVVDVGVNDPLHAALSDRSIPAEDRIALALAGPAFQWR